MSSAGVSLSTITQQQPKQSSKRHLRTEAVMNDTNPLGPPNGTTQTATEERRVVSIVDETRPQSTFPAFRSPTISEYFKAIKNWEGVVESIGEKTFFATVRDISNSDDQGNELFEIDIEDVDEQDRELIVEGAIFYLTVGYTIRRGGQRIKGVQIVFRRMPAWSAKDIERAREQADRYRDKFEGRAIG